MMRERLGAASAGERLSSAWGSICKAVQHLCRAEGRGTPAQSQKEDLGLLQMENWDCVVLVECVFQGGRGAEEA